MLDDLLSKIMPGEIIPLVAITLGISAGIIISLGAIIAGQVRRYRERQIATNLIHDLVERGLSADEIERLVRASAVQSPEDGAGDA